MPPRSESRVRLGVGPDGLVNTWEREAALDQEMAVRCSLCRWSAAGIARDVLAAQARHRESHEAPPPRDPDAVCPKGHEGEVYRASRAGGGFRRRCRVCDRLAKRPATTSLELLAG